MIAKNRKIKSSGNFQETFFVALIATFLVAVIVFLAVSNLKISQKRSGVTDRIEEIQKEIDFLEEKNKQLKEGIIQTESDAYWEEKLYEQGYKKTGEEAIVIVPPEGEEKTKEPEKSFWENLRAKVGF